MLVQTQVIFLLHTLILPLGKACIIAEEYIDLISKEYN